jgi:D-arabinose 1-dehydrogenase-like Zn-dependent alcohol dehydrogenase
MVRINGTYLDIGNIGGGRLDIPAGKIIGNQTKWVGTVHYNPWVIEAALQFLVKTRDKYQLMDVVSDSFPLEKVNEAFEFAEWQGKETGTQAQRVALSM